MTQLLWYYAKVLAKTKNDNTNLETQLSNDPGKKGSNFFCCDAIRFPYIKMFSCLRRECINLQKDCLRKKMYLNSTFKGSIFLSKHFDQSQELQTMAKKCSQFTWSAHTISVRGGSRGRVQGVRIPPPPWDDLRFSNTTGILQKKNVVYWCWSRARDECTPS